MIERVSRSFHIWKMSRLPFAPVCLRTACLALLPDLLSSPHLCPSSAFALFIFTLSAQKKRGLSRFASFILWYLWPLGKPNSRLEMGHYISSCSSIPRAALKVLNFSLHFWSRQYHWSLSSLQRRCFRIKIWLSLRADHVDFRFWRKQHLISYVVNDACWGQGRRRGEEGGEERIWGKVQRCFLESKAVEKAEDWCPQFFRRVLLDVGKRLGSITMGGARFYGRLLSHTRLR